MERVNIYFIASILKMKLLEGVKRSGISQW